MNLAVYCVLHAVALWAACCVCVCVCVMCIVCSCLRTTVHCQDFIWGPFVGESWLLFLRYLQSVSCVRSVTRIIMTNRAIICTVELRNSVS